MDMADRKTIVALIEGWKTGQTMTAMEMLKTAFKPLIDLEVGKHVLTGVRGDDVRRIAEEIVEEAITSYSSPDVDPVNYVTGRLEGTAARIEALRQEIAALRKTRKG
jgi:hypothetical protein